MRIKVTSNGLQDLNKVIELLETAIDTNVPGIRLGDLLPMCAKVMDKWSIVRSLYHGDAGHSALDRTLDGKAFPMIGTGLGNDPITRQRPTARLDEFLKAGLGIGMKDAGAFRDRILQESFDDPTHRIEPGVEVNGAEDRLDSVRARFSSRFAFDSSAFSRATSAARKA